MNIVLPIISNLLIVLSIVLGVFIGKKNEWKLSLIKLVSVLAIGVGLYFLNPLIANLVNKIPFIANCEYISFITLKSITFALSFIILTGILNIVLLIIRHHRNKVRFLKSENMVLKQRAKAIDKNVDKVLKREERKTNRLKRKQLAKQHKKARIFGSIIEVLVVIVSLFVVFIPVKYITKEINNETINSTYEYTPFGQLDKITNIDQFIIKGE